MAYGGSAVTVVGLDSQGIIAPFAFKGAMTGDIFNAYAETQLAPLLGPGDVVFVDGLGAHRTAMSRALIEATGASLKILPSYSPDLTPVENCGSKIKEIIRSLSPRTVDEVIDAMAVALGAVTSADARGWFEHCGYCVNTS